MTTHYKIMGRTLFRYETCEHRGHCKCPANYTGVIEELTLTQIAEIIQSAGHVLSQDRALEAEDGRRRREDEAEAARWESEMDARDKARHGR